MVESNSGIIESIHSDQLIKYQKGVRGIRQRSTSDAKAHNLRKCSVNIGLRRTIDTGDEITP